MATKTASAVRSALSSARADLDELRDRIATLKEQRDGLEFGHRDRASVEAFIDGEIARAAASEPFRLGALWSRDMRPDEYRATFNTSAVGSPIYTGGANDAGRSMALGGDMFAVLAAWDAPRLKSLIMAHVPDDGMSDGDVSATMAKLDREILQAEVAEEVCAREIEAEIGARIMRRPDANPAVFLATTAALTGGAK